MIRVNDIALSDEAVRACEESAAAVFAREWKNSEAAAKACFGNSGKVLPVIFRRASAEIVGDPNKPNPDYVCPTTTTTERQ